MTAFIDGFWFGLGATAGVSVFLGAKEYIIEPVSAWVRRALGKSAEPPK